MGFLYITLISVVQGITEFLPISSSGHLVFLSQLLSQTDHTLDLDISVHFGTLIAVIIIYRKDVSVLFQGTGDIFKKKLNSPNAYFLQRIIVATIPVILAGFLMRYTIQYENFRSIKIVGFSMIFFGIILYIADKFGSKTRDQSECSFKEAIFIGLWQALALIPGSSRSGSTISGALILGFSRKSSIDLSMILSIPTIIASATLLLIDLLSTNFDNFNIIFAASASFLSFLSALITLMLFLKYIDLTRFTPFVIYRVFFGLFLLLIAS